MDPKLNYAVKRSICFDVSRKTVMDINTVLTLSSPTDSSANACMIGTRVSVLR